MTGILNTLIAGVSGAVKDAYFNLVSLLLPGNGTNGAQNNTFLDSSTNNFTITRNGNTTQGTFSPFSQTGWGNYFNGTSSYISAGSSSAFAFGTGIYTVEAWVYVTGSNSENNLFCNDTTNGFDLYFNYTSSTTRLEFRAGASVIAFSGVPTRNSWVHVAVVREGTGTNQTKLYFNGSLQGSGTDASNWTITGPMLVGGVAGAAYLSGYISNARIVKGVAVYTGAFTPPILPLTATQSAGTNISAITTGQTSLLTCQSNRFIDNGQGNTGNTSFTITPSGSPSVVAFSPFAPTAAYTTAAVGGSGYFDGTGDSLSITDNAAFDFGSGAFTVEAWFYRTGGGDRISQTIYNQSALAAASNSALFFGAGNNGLSLYLSTGGSSWTNSIETGVAPALNAWSHVVWQRNGNTLEIYLNGALQTVVSGTAAFSGTIFNSSRDVEIGIQASTNGPLFGNLCNLRVVKGATVYTGNFTPPTGQLATSGSASAASYPSTTNVNTSFASSACSLLLNYTNAGITDATAKNDLETVGNAQISTSVSKFGGGSIAFDGSGDYLKAPTSDSWNLGSGDFAIEFFIRFNSIGATNNAIAGKWGNGAGTYAWLVQINSSQLTLYTGNNGTLGTQLTFSWTPSTNVWYFVAISRTSGNVRAYVDTNQIGTTQANSHTLSSTAGLCAIGENSDGGGQSQFINGYLDDLRITRGYNRGYSGSTITVPTAPFPVQ